MGHSWGAGPWSRPVERSMDRWPAVIPAGTGVRDAVALLSRSARDCGVVEGADGDWIGVITLAALLREREVQHRSDPTAAFFRLEREATAEDLMIPAWLSVSTDAPLHLAAALMADEHVDHLPVVDAEGQVVGTLSAFDLLGAVAATQGYRVGTTHVVRRRELDGTAGN